MEIEEMSMEEYVKAYQQIIDISCDLEDIDNTTGTYQHKLILAKAMLDCINDVPNSKINYYLDITDEETQEAIIDAYLDIYKQ